MDGLALIENNSVVKTEIDIEKHALLLESLTTTALSRFVTNWQMTIPAFLSERRSLSA
jgi:hypothetical protein